MSRSYTTFDNNSNILFQEEIYKVGRTEKDPHIRASELSSSTGVPTSFIVVQSWKTENYKLIEKLIHADLDNFRFNKKREFFNCNFEIIRSVIESRLEKTGEY